MSEMTEAEAQTKACCGPFAGRLPYGTAGDAYELAVQGTDPMYAAETAARWPCIGSSCMAWRWAGPIPTAGQVSADLAIAVAGTNAQRAEVRARLAAQRPGFCGLSLPPTNQVKP